jgi:16S rRNA (adenine1518-N6/adenine1519-N6)-dimethyltransferase
MIKKPLKLLFKNYEKVAEKLSLDLNLRPQNLTNITYYRICSYYEKLLN